MMQSMIRVRQEEEEEDPVLEMFTEKCQLHYQTIDSQYLQKYNEYNEHFSMETITTTENEEEENKLVGYTCLYRYGTHEVKLKYDISSEKWTIVLDKHCSQEDKPLKTLISYINEKFLCIKKHYTLDEQIQNILKEFDGYFNDINQVKATQQNEKKMSENLTSIEKYECDPEKSPSHASLTSSTTFDVIEQEENRNLEKEEITDNIHSLRPDSHPKISCLTSPPVAPRRSRQNSAYSTHSSVRYATFLPPKTAPLRQRRVIESILVHVERKKKLFDKLVNVFKGRKSIILNDLGLEFLREYDGRFNYREGHRFIMPFRKKTWYLTIDEIKCVDCVVGEREPLSVLILHYKDKYINIHA